MVFGNPAASSGSATYISIVGIPSSNDLTSLTWASTGGGQLTAVISGSPVTTYRRGQYVRFSGATNTGTGGAAAVNTTFPLISASGGTLVAAAPAAGGVFGTIGGALVLNNDRAQISPPIGYLTTALTAGATSIVLDDAADFNPSGDIIYAWGNGDTSWQAVGMAYTGVSGNTLTGVTNSSSLTSTVPIGTPIVATMRGQKAILTPAATDPIGNTLSNLEIWAGAAFASGAGLFQWTATPGTNQGSMTLNKMFLHDNMMGIRPGSCSVGSGTFLDVFDSEVWQSSILGDRNHNVYIDFDIFLFQNSISWHCPGVHLVKSRCRTNYILQSRTYGAWGSTANTFGNRTTNYDFPNGGLVYLIGCILAASEQDNGALVRYQEETGNYPLGGIGNSGYNGALGTSNPIAEIYAVNSNLLGPANGTGYSFASSFANNAPLVIAYPGLANPEVARITSTAGGALPARTYWNCTTLLDSGGNETLPSCMTGNDCDQTVTAKAAIGANSLAVTPSPIPRTGGVTWNNYMAHADPDIWWNSGGVVPPATGPNLFFYDSAFTLPVCVVNAGGSQPRRSSMQAITYVFSDGTESVNFAVSGNDLRFPSGSPLQVNAAMINRSRSNSLLTIKTPPAKTGATGWYPQIAVVPYNAGGAYNIGRCFLSKQVFTPIAIGTDWVQTDAFITAATCQYNFYKQNASPIAIGTDWTEPTSGLTNLNPNLLKWYQRNIDPALGFSEWFAVATSAYTDYVVNAYNDQQWGSYFTRPANGVVCVWSGAAGGAYPFDADYPAATLTTSASSTTATTAATHTAILAAFRDSATAGAGYTQQAALPFMMAQSKIVTTAQTGLAVTQTGGGATSILVDALSGTITQRGSAVTWTANTNNMQFTIPSISIGDVLTLVAVVGNGPQLLAVDPLAWGAPAQNQAINAAPIGSIINCVSAYYNPTGAGSAGGGFATGGWLQTYPGVLLYGGVSYPTVSSFNLQADTFNGTTFAAPLVAAVWTDAPNDDFTLAGSSPAIGAGTNPGTGHSFSLVPVYQTSMIGTPVPGGQIAALTARSDGGTTLGAIGSGVAPPAPALRLKFRFGWDWKLGAALLAAAVIQNNPSVSRRNMLLLTDETKAAPPRGKRSRLRSPPVE